MKERHIHNFQGEGVVIGCGHTLCTKHHHDDDQHFFTIDRDKMQNPDLVFDITHKLPKTYDSRFKLTFLECLPYAVYNKNNLNDLRKQNAYQGMQGFDNIWNMTQDEGFILIQGCRRDKSFRWSLAQRKQSSWFFCKML